MRRPPIAAAAGVIVVVLALAGAARADAGDDLFGLHHAPAPADTPCDDGSGFVCVFATDPLAARGSPVALSSILAPGRWHDLAVADADHDAIAGFALGSARDDAGVVLGGATGLDNRWLVEGAPTEALRTGGVETRVPLAFIDSITVTAGGFGAADLTSTGGSIDVGLIRGGDHREVSAELWGSATAGRRSLPRIPLRYDPIAASAADPRAISFAVVARGPLARVAGARIWYAAGLRPSLRDDGLDRAGARLVDADADGRPDLDGAIPITEPIELRALHEVAYQVPVLARLGAERGHHAVELTALVTGYRDTRYATAASELAAGIRRSGAIADGIATWRGRWARTRARVIASWHRSAFDERPRRGDPAEPQLATAFIPTALADDPTLAEACDDTATGDPYPGIPNCPVARGLFASGGAGLLLGQTADRPALSADVAHRLGDHTVAVGIAGEDGRLITRRRYTGGEQIRSLFDGFTDTIRFVEIGTGADTVPCSDDPAITDRCRAIDRSTLTLRTRQLAAFVADDWRPRRDVAFTGGVRWESMQLGGAFKFRDELSPRIGAAWDFAGRGRSRLFAGFGRRYAVIPAGLGDTVVARPPTVRNIDLAGVPSVIYDDGAALGVAADLAPVLVEELVGGIELVRLDAVRGTAWGQVRWLRRGLETERGALVNPVDPPATSRSTVIAVELATPPGHPLGVRVQYQYTRSHGATPGPFDPRQGGELYAGTDYDSGVDGANLVGTLPSDLRHRAVIEATARGHLGPVPIVVSIRAQLSSGRPSGAVAQNSHGTILLVPRGSLGRLDQLTSTSVHLAADLGHGIDLVVDGFNLFDRQRVTAVDELYTRDEVLPIHGGRADDLVFLETETGRAVVRNPGFGRATARQAPLSVAVGVRARF